MQPSHYKNKQNGKRNKYFLFLFLLKVTKRSIPFVLSTIAGKRFSGIALNEYASILLSTPRRNAFSMMKRSPVYLTLQRAIRVAVTCVCVLVESQFSACNKFVEIEPPITSTNGEIIYRDEATAVAAVTGIYINMSNAGVATADGWLTNVFFMTGLTSDELELWDKTNDQYSQFYTNNISPQINTWANIYKMIFTSNSAIEELPKSTSLSLAVRNQLLGESKFIRALCYFYLINLYGDVPFAFTTDYKINGLLPRMSTVEIYKHIEEDLKASKNLLNENYVGKDCVSGTTERIRPNKSTAAALLARIYLYTSKYGDAESEATSIINNSSLYNLTDLNSTFLMNSHEAIWQLQPVGLSSNNSANTKEGYTLKLLPTGPDNFFNPVYLTPFLVNSFDHKDQRKVEWINNVTIGNQTYYYPFKYKKGRENEPTTEYSTVFRLAEQYLIRAEARIQQGNIIDGIADLNVLRNRATDLTASPDNQLSKLSPDISKDEALLAVESERRHELFTEWGHRWFDLKRYGRTDVVLGSIKGSDWQTTDQLFPLPQSEIDGNPNMKGHQNPGYSN